MRKAGLGEEINHEHRNNRLWQNGEWYQTEEVFMLVNKIGELAEGSYGLIYLYDDEAVGKENQFQVFSLSRGSVEEFSDQFLSPIAPTIEDVE